MKLKDKEKKNMSNELDYLKRFKGMNISYDCSDVIDDLKFEFIQSGNIDVNVYYKIGFQTMIDNELIEFPVYIDYLTNKELKENEQSFYDDLKDLNMVKMSIVDAVELFEYQNTIIK